MPICKLLRIAATLAVIASPATAQQVIYEPGYCAFFYPNANCQNKGPGNPYTGDYQRRVSQGETIPGSQTLDVARKRTPKSTTRMQ